MTVTPRRPQAAHRQCRNDQAGEDEVDADELHRRRHRQGEQQVEAEAPDALARAEPQPEHDDAEHRHGHDLGRRDPQDLADEQVLEVLAALRVVGEQQQRAGRREHEQRADQRLLEFRPVAVGPRQQPGAADRRDGGRDLHAPPAFVDAVPLREDHAERGDLRDRQVDEDDAAREHLLAQRHVRGQKLGDATAIGSGVQVQHALAAQRLG